MPRRRVAWQVPQSGSAIDLVALYPALYLSGTFDVPFVRQISAESFDHADVVVLPLWRGEEEPARATATLAAERNLPIVVVPWTAPTGSFEAIAQEAGARTFIADPLGGTPREDSIGGVALVPPFLKSEDRLLRRILQKTAASNTPQAASKAITLVAFGATQSVPDHIVSSLRGHADTCVLIAPRPEDVDLGISVSQALRLDSPDIIDAIIGAKAIILLPDEFDPFSVAPLIVARSALAWGVPVIAGAHPSLLSVAADIITDDWDRGLRVLSSGKVPSALRRRARGVSEHSPAFGPGQTRKCWERLLTDLPAHDSRARRHSKARTLLVLFDQPQDLDILLPIIETARQRGIFKLRLTVSDWLRETSPRTIGTLERLGHQFEYVVRRHIRAGRNIDLVGMDAVLAATESTVSAHKAGHALANAARAANIPAFTLQHGFENIGINYADSVHGHDVMFASSHVFIWGRTDQIPDWVPADTVAKLIPAGMPGKPPEAASPPKIAGSRGRRTVGIFENLHWHRYDDAYRAAFLGAVLAVAETWPDIVLLIKPHHAGRWSAKENVFGRAPSNVVVLDPAQPEWQPYTAPALMGLVDAVITTPSTVAVDGVRAGKPTAVVGGALDLPLYAPLPVLRTHAEWFDFLGIAQELGYLEKNEQFLEKNLIPGRGDIRMVDWIDQLMR